MKNKLWMRKIKVTLTSMIPYENERDIDDIPEEVKKVLEIIPVKNVMEVINRAIIK